VLLRGCSLFAARFSFLLAHCSSLCPDLFNLRYSAKSLTTESKKSEKNAAMNKIKCKKAMEVQHSNATTDAKSTSKQAAKEVSQSQPNPTHSPDSLLCLL
jgi:hypothetical protein